ncbi:ABC transporter ATP-binding protein [Halobacteriales archaeon QS_1_68_20]|nr:MAG: ABC transporter ATP-binding protein [Halobacteriales archaeon QS_1_68_20]
MNAIETRGLTKRFGGQYWIPGFREGSPPQTAVQDLNLTVKLGEVFGFLGPNGAGKSTSINLLLDYVRPTAGFATVLGMDTREHAKAIHDRIGVLPEHLTLWDRLTARKHVEFVAETKTVAVDAGAILARIGLEDAADQPVGEFSTGMTQRLGLGMALVGEPDLLILDEPTAALDPNGVRRLREIVEEEATRGATVFFSSHVLEQVEAVCDRVAILRDGHLVAVDTMEGLRENVGAGETLTILVEDPTDDVRSAVRNVENVADVAMEGQVVEATCTAGRAKVNVINAIRETGTTIRDFDVETVDLESLFAAYAGDRLGSDGEQHEQKKVTAQGGRIESGPEPSSDQV